MIQDGSSFAVKDRLRDVFPGRFKRVSPAAVELHVSMDLLNEALEHITLTPDTFGERAELPEPQGRYLSSIGIWNEVVDSSSIEVNRRQRRAKTDRIDGEKLLTMLMRCCGGERNLWSVVQVPSVEEEDARRLHRELERLKKERTGHCNRLRGLLVAQGVRLAPGRDFLEHLDKESLWDGRPLPADLKGELEREYQRGVSLCS